MLNHPCYGCWATELYGCFLKDLSENFFYARAWVNYFSSILGFNV
jgi:hypothetical protein